MPQMPYTYLDFEPEPKERRMKIVRQSRSSFLRMWKISGLIVEMFVNRPKYGNL
jgi:hypothetical protein